MDLHFSQARATDQERRTVDAFLQRPAALGADGGVAGGRARGGRVGSDGRQVRSQRHLLLPTLQAVCSRVGFVSPGALNYVCSRLTVPPADAYGVASFYALLSTVPRAPRVLWVCDDIACKLAAADSLCENIARAHGQPQAHDLEQPCAWRRSPCLGLCDKAPAGLVMDSGSLSFDLGGEPVYRLSANVAAALLSGSAPPPWEPAVAVAHPEAKLLKRVGRVDPTDLGAYRQSGGLAGFERALQLGPAGVAREVIASKLMGRGGAAFPTGRKWEAVAREAAQPHYLICNADESEPGTFKDRVLMEEDPFAVLEGMMIAAYAGGCLQGYLYIRGEYPVAAERMRNATESLRAAGLMGNDIGGSGFSFDVELRRGAGAYICGEETALFNSIEGMRGEPRNKPPFPAQKGLFAKPTIINNVETLANVAEIVKAGGSAFASIGTPDSTGTKLFCLCGHVARPGLYEVPLGTRLEEVIALAGGVRGGAALQAVLLGGAAGSFLTPAELSVSLSFEGVRAVGASLGSGVIMLLDASADLRSFVLRIAEFFRDESCGQCVPCRVGTVRQEELLQRLAARKPNGSYAAERGLLREIGQVMRDASICGLGQTASAAVESALAKFGVFDG